MANARIRFKGLLLQQARRNLSHERVAEIRKRIGSDRRGKLTQEELVTAAKYKSRNVVGKAERDNDCSQEAANRFAEVLGIEVAEFYREEIVDGTGHLSADERQVVAVMRTCPDARDYVLTNALAFDAAMKRVARLTNGGDEGS